MKNQLAGSAQDLIANSFRDAFYSLADLVLTNLLWVVFTLLIVTAPPAAAGLYYSTNQLAHDRKIGWRTFFEGFRLHFWVSWRWGLLNLFIIATSVFNVLFYGSFDKGWVPWVQALFISLLIIWGMLQLYTFPLLLEQDEPQLRMALRNSLALLGKRPWMAIGLFLLMVVLAALSTLLQLPWLFFTGSLCAFLSNRSTLYLIEAYQS